jgi:hypothetical protein
VHREGEVTGIHVGYQVGHADLGLQVGIGHVAPQAYRMVVHACMSAQSAERERGGK